jgi:hypothetical protein
MASPAKQSVQAARSGIGARLLELGFKRKSNRLYELDEGELHFWVRFKYSSDDTFGDRAGVRSDEFTKLVESAGEDLYHYLHNENSDAHVSFSAIGNWSAQVYNAEDAFKHRYRRLGPINWFIPWDRLLRRRNPYWRSPYVQNDRWRAMEDPDGCAEASLAKWREVIEPWLAAMRDRKQFAQMYRGCRWYQGDSLVIGIAWVYAGDIERARPYIQEPFDARYWTIEDAIRMFRRRPNFRRLYPTDDKLQAAAARSVAMAQAESAQALRVAQRLNIQLKGAPLLPPA